MDFKTLQQQTPKGTLKQKLLKWKYLNNVFHYKDNSKCNSSSIIDFNYNVNNNDDDNANKVIIIIPWHTRSWNMLWRLRCSFCGG